MLKFERKEYFIKTGLDDEFITELDVNTEFDLITEFRRFPWNIATGAASQQRTLTPPDTWSCPIWDLHLF